eukprot:Sspe_Gene.82878::Locus_54339_Transcript_2_4_Confidence_0.571_Length_309::g.82878::m.82878
MNCINQAYGKISDPGERLETMKEAEDVRTAGKTWSEHQQTAEGMHANFASRASRWKETEDHRRRMKERLRKNKYKKVSPSTPPLPHAFVLHPRSLFERG